MNTQTMVRDWARKLIASESTPDPTCAQSETATLCVYEKLRRQLCAPVGVEGFQALASRALSLAKSQTPRLREVQILPDGGLSGLTEVQPRTDMDRDDDGDAGIILITQFLRLLLTLLGESATASLIAELSPENEATAELDTTPPRVVAAGTNYLGPFENILTEANQLRHVSERLEILADTHDGVEELMSVAGNIRRIASSLDVFTIIRSKAGGSRDSVLHPSLNEYSN